MKKLLWVIPVLLYGLCIAEAKTVDRIIAQVNDDIITLSELNERMAGIRQELAAKYAGEQLEKLLQDAEKQALESLVEEKLLYQKAMELGVGENVDAQVAAYLQQIIKEYNLKDMDTLENELAKQGKTLKDFREEKRREIIIRELVDGFVGSRISLLTPEVEKYYRDHAADFTTPEEVTLSEIILTGEGAESRANELYRRLQQGESFSALASQYSKGPTANKGGSTGTYLVSKLRPEEVQAIANLKEGDISKPQKFQDGYLIYHIDGRKYAAVKSLDEVRDEIRTRLYNAKFAPEYERFISQLKDDAYINYPPEIK